MRSRRVAMDATRNIVINGKMPSSDAPIGVEGPGAAVEHVPQQGEHHARHHDHQGDGARVVAQLAQHAGGGGEGAGGRS